MPPTTRKALLAAGVLAGVLAAVTILAVYVAGPGHPPDLGQGPTPTETIAPPTLPTVTPPPRLQASGPEEARTAESTPPDPTSAPPQIIARGSTDFFQIAIGEIEYAREFASHHTDQTLCIIPLTVENKSSEARILVLSDFYLLDADNHHYSTLHSEGFRTRIPPAGSESGVLVYELPIAARPHELVLADSSHAAQVLLRLRLEP